MGRKRIVHRHAGSHSEQSHADQRQQNARKTYTCCEHGDNFVGARHSAQSKKERQQKRNREQNDQNLRDLCGVITKAKKQTDMFVDKRRNVIAHVEKDRKSTRLNSSHRCISYAVFCLKKKTRS